MSKIWNIYNTSPLKGHAPKSHKLHKNGGKWGNFSKLFDTTNLTEWELLHIGLFLTNIPLLNTPLHFHSCSSGANFCH